MKFPRFNYMKWTKMIEQMEGLHLSTSSVPQLTQEDLQLAKNPPEIIQRSAYGDLKLIDLIAKKYNTQPENIFLCPGSSTANYIVCAVLLEQSYEVIVECPVYGVLAQLPEVFGAKVKRLHRKFKNAWQIDYAELENLITNKTKMIVLTNPHNPTGKAFTTQDYKKLSQIASKYNVHLLIDEVYIDTCPENPRISSEDFNEKFIFTNSFTKSFGLGGIRIGWAIASPELTQDFNDFNDLISVNNSEPSMDIALQAIKMLDENMTRFRQIVKENVKTVESWLKEIPEFSWVKPDGVAFGFIKVDEKIDIDKLCQILADQFKTFIVPGKFFDNHEHFFRLGFGLTSDKLKQGLKNISQVLQLIKK